MKTITPLAERFWQKVPDQPGLDCWEWQGAHGSWGYGSIGIGSRTDGSRRTIPAHRVAYEFCRGAIPTGLFVLHACDNPGCVNPDHLFLGTNDDNMKDMAKKGRGTFKTQCSKGHQFTDENTYHHPLGYKVCLICRRRHALAWYYRNRKIQ